MSTPLPYSLLRRLAMLACSLAAGASLLSAASPAAWDPVDPAQLAETAPRLDPDAPAEVLFWKVTIDDRDYPQARRVREYVRYKVYDPEKAVDLTRVSQISGSFNGQSLRDDVALQGRLILPDGTTREFGKESIQERPLVRTGATQSWSDRLFGSEGLEETEKFLAVSGIEPGSILEFQFAHTEHTTVWEPAEYILQRSIPVRRLELTQQVCRDDDSFAFQPFVLNRHQAEVHADPKKHAFSLVAHDLPALVAEPFSGVPADYALTYLFTYRVRNPLVITHHIGDAIRVDGKSGPWAGDATLTYMFEKDMATPDAQIEHLAAQLTAGAPSALERARRIHQFVQELHQRFLLVPRKSAPTLNPADYLQSLDQLLDFEKNPNLRILPHDFQWLAIALYRAAGFQAQTVLLPNRGTARFNPRLVAEMFLPDYGARVLVDGQWRFDSPESAARVPFGLLPWQSAGQVGLIAQPNKQEFVDVPLTPADQSVIANAGDFALDPKGNLTGDCRRTYTGQNALALRARFRRANAVREQGIVRRILAAEFKPALIKVTDLAGADDPEAPLVVSYQMRYRDFAVLTKERMIFRPFIFHAMASSPFASATRQYNLEFPYPWTESDALTLKLPAGYRLESKLAPPSFPGEILSYRSELSVAAGEGVLHVSREFVSKVLTAPATAYGPVKTWYDNVAANDQHELVLAREPAVATAAAGP